MGNNQQNEEDWEIWHQDNFDPGMPRQVILTGEELMDGLTKLWTRHLYESVKLDGFSGFSKYNLWLVQSKQSIEVIGDLSGQKKLHEWIFGGNLQDIKGSVDVVGQNLLGIIVKTHYRLFQEGKTSEIIFEIARNSDNRHQFEKLLEKL